MPASATLDPAERSAATVGASPFSTSAFSDATVLQAGSFSRATTRQVLVHTAPGFAGRLVSGLETLGTSRIADDGPQRLGAVLRRINELLSQPGTADTDPVNSEVVAQSLPVVAPAIAETGADAEVFPLADGGLLFRWDTVRGSVEVEFDSEGDTVVMIDDQERETRRVGYLSELWPTAQNWLRQL